MTFLSWLRLSLGIQILLYAWAMAILYSSSHDGASNFNGLYALIPFGLFGILCITNLVLLCIYIPKMLRQKRSIDPTVIVFTLISILLICLYHVVASWALNGSG